MILPNIIPTKGTKIVSLNFKRDRIVINNNVPRKDTVTAMVVFNNIEAVGKNSIAIKSRSTTDYPHLTARTRGDII